MFNWKHWMYLLWPTPQSKPLPPAQDTTDAAWLLGGRPWYWYYTPVREGPCRRKR